MKYLTVCFIILMISGCNNSSGIEGNSNSNNQVVSGDGSSIVNNETNNNTTINQNPSEEPPPDIDAPIITMSNEGLIGTGSGCGELVEDTVTVAEYLKSDYVTIEDPLILEDSGKTRETYYIAKNLPNSDMGWMPMIFVPGRQLRIEYYTCGSGGFKYLTSIEALSSSG